MKYKNTKRVIGFIYLITLIIMFLNFLATNFAPEIITSFAFEKKKYSIMSEELKEKIGF